MVVVGGCPTPCKKGGELSGRGNVREEYAREGMSGGNVLHWCWWRLCVSQSAGVCCCCGPAHCALLGNNKVCTSHHITSPVITCPTRWVSPRVPPHPVCVLFTSVFPSLSRLINTFLTFSPVVCLSRRVLDDRLAGDIYSIHTTERREVGHCV